MQTAIYYRLATFLNLFSFLKDKNKPKLSHRKAWKSFVNILPQLLGMISVIGIIIAYLSPQTISNLIGGSSGWLGVLSAAIVGSITLIPAFVAFPMAAILLENGAGYMQLSAFASTLTMVGLITLPLEIKFFGRKFALLRNILAFVFAFIVAFVIGWVVG